MAEDDDTIETVVYQGQQAAKQLCKGLHRFLPLTLLREQNHRTKNRWRSKFQICLGRFRRSGIAPDEDGNDQLPLSQFRSQERTVHLFSARKLLPLFRQARRRRLWLRWR